MHVGDLEYIFLATLIEQRQTSGQLQTTEVRSAEMHDRVFHQVKSTRLSFGTDSRLYRNRQLKLLRGRLCGVLYLDLMGDIAFNFSNSLNEESDGITSSRLKKLNTIGGPRWR